MKNNQSHLNYSRVQIATAIAIVFHAIGLIGILFLDKSFFIQTTPINLLLMFLLIIYTQDGLNKNFLFFILLTFIFGIVIEIIGTSTGYLFGNYKYGSVLGPTINDVPLIIGLNWFIVIYCCGISINLLLNKMVNQLTEITENKRPIVKLLSIVVDGATLAVLFDWLMEPVAIKLGFWSWGGDGSVPYFNYTCWFIASLILLYIFHQLNFEKRNKFALHLLMIQVMFFLILRTLL